MDDVVTIQHRNVCKDGFTIVDEADAGMWTRLPIYGYPDGAFKKNSFSRFTSTLGRR